MSLWGVCVLLCAFMCMFGELCLRLVCLELHLMQCAGSVCRHVCIYVHVQW
jgi:hypothetical protein